MIVASLERATAAMPLTSFAFIPCSSPRSSRHAPSRDRIFETQGACKRLQGIDDKRGRMQCAACRAAAERSEATLRAQRTLRRVPPQIHVSLLVESRQHRRALWSLRVNLMTINVDRCASQPTLALRRPRELRADERVKCKARSNQLPILVCSSVTIICVVFVLAQLGFAARPCCECAQLCTSRSKWEKSDTSDQSHPTLFA